MYAEAINVVNIVGIVIVVLRLLVGWSYGRRTHKLWTFALPTVGLLIFIIRSAIFRNYEISVYVVPAGMDVTEPALATFDLFGLLAWLALIVPQAIAVLYQWWPGEVVHRGVHS